MRVLTIILMCAIAASGCTNASGSDDGSGGGDVDGGGGGDTFFTATIDGTAFTADLSASTTWGAFKYHPGTLSISVSDDLSLSPGMQSFLININSGYDGEGTHTLGVGGNGNYARFDVLNAPGSSDTWAAETAAPGEGGYNTTTTGEIVITSDAGGFVDGTFEFDGEHVTNASHKAISGAFRLEIQ